jgi:hypothetical protein
MSRIAGAAGPKKMSCGRRFPCEEFYNNWIVETNL